jgi:hypothetical protein
MTTEHMSIEDYRLLLSRGGLRSAPKRKTEEEDLHRACIELAERMEWKYPILKWLFHCPSGGLRPKGEAGKLKALGAKKGYPDLTLHHESGPWRGFACELKSSTGRLSAEQKDWLAMFQSQGYLVCVHRTLAGFQDDLQIFLSGQQSIKGGVGA